MKILTRRIAGKAREVWNRPTTVGHVAPIIAIVACTVAISLWQVQRVSSAVEQDRVIAAQRSDDNRIEAEQRAERQRCTDLVERTDGLRFVLESVYDNFDMLYSIVDLNADTAVPGVADAVQRVERGRAEIDVLYPQLSIDDCVATVPPERN